MNIVLFENSEINLPLSIDDNRAKHIIQILHKKEGEFFDAGIIGGKAGKAKILKIDETGLNFEFTEETDGKSLYPLSMIIGFPRPIQLKRLFRDMAGLGTESIHLTGTELGEKSYMQSNIVEKGTAYNLLKEGTIQAKSTHIPELILHQNLSECVEKILKTNYS